MCLNCQIFSTHTLKKIVNWGGWIFVKRVNEGLKVFFTLDYFFKIQTAKNDILYYLEVSSKLGVLFGIKILFQWKSSIWNSQVSFIPYYFNGGNDIRSSWFGGHHFCHLDCHCSWSSQSCCQTQSLTIIDDIFLRFTNIIIIIFCHFLAMLF